MKKTYLTPIVENAVVVMGQKILYTSGESADPTNSNTTPSVSNPLSAPHKII